MHAQCGAAPTRHNVDRCAGAEPFGKRHADGVRGKRRRCGVATLSARGAYCGDAVRGLTFGDRPRRWRCGGGGGGVCHGVVFLVVVLLWWCVAYAATRGVAPTRSTPNKWPWKVPRKCRAWWCASPALKHSSHTCGASHPVNSAFGA
jgi:hypothetical protein